MLAGLGKITYAIVNMIKEFCEHMEADKSLVVVAIFHDQAITCP